MRRFLANDSEIEKKVGTYYQQLVTFTSLRTVIPPMFSLSRR